MRICQKKKVDRSYCVRILIDDGFCVHKVVRLAGVNFYTRPYIKHEQFSFMQRRMIIL